MDVDDGAGAHATNGLNMAAAAHDDLASLALPELEAALQAAVGQGDWGRARAAAEAMEIAVQTGHWPPAGGGGGGGGSLPPTTLLAMQLLLTLIARDLNNARHLWRRTPAHLKGGEGSSPLAQAWAVGKLLWTRDVPEALALLAATQWPAELRPLATALQARVRSDELELCSRAYKTIKVPTLAAKLGVSPAEALEAARQAGWTVDENGGMLQPCPRPPQEAEAIGLPQLAQLAKYVAFLEQKSPTHVTA